MDQSLLLWSCSELRPAVTIKINVVRLWYISHGVKLKLQCVYFINFKCRIASFYGDSYEVRNLLILVKVSISYNSMYDCSEMVFMHLPAIFFLIAMLLYALNGYVENSCSFPLWNNCPYFSMRFICAPQTPEDMRVLFIRKLMIRFFLIVL